MKKSNSRSFTAVITIAVLSVACLPAHAQNAPETLYKAKCAACHSPDGSGSAVGRKLGSHDFHSPEVQAQSDADLAGIIAKGKNKMPAYEKSLKADEIAALVTYIRSFAPAK